MPSFDELRGKQPPAPEYEEVKGVWLVVKTTEGVDEYFLEDGDRWERFNDLIIITLQRDHEEVEYNRNHVIGVSRKDGVIKRPKVKFKPEGS